MENPSVGNQADLGLILGFPELVGPDRHETVLRLPVRMFTGHISQNPGVCGGRACILNSRMPVWSLELMRRQGTGHEAILESFPTLSRLDLLAVLVYAWKHRDEIDRDIRENDEDRGEEIS